MWIIVGGLTALGVLLVASPSISSLRMPRVVRVGAPLAPVRFEAVCVTRGTLSPSDKVNVPTFRAVTLGTSGDAIALYFTYEGRSIESRALASGQVRRQIGLKLRAANGCNLVYVMWRLDPKPQLEVSIKVNPGMRTHRECGASGYTKLRPSHYIAVPAPRVGGRHMLQAAIMGGELFAWIDGQLAWRGSLPDEARFMTGPSGIRSDNLAYSILGLWAPVGHTGAEVPRCVTDGED